MKEAEKPKEPLLKINLPAPPNNNPNEKISYGTHNAVHLKNYRTIANLIQGVINNQKMIAASLATLEKKIKKTEKPIKLILQQLNKLNLKEKKDGKTR